MQLVKVRREKVSVKVKMTRKEKNVIKNMIALGMMVGGVASFVMALASIIFCDPSLSLMAVPSMMRFSLLGLVLVFTGPYVKYCVKF